MSETDYVALHKQAFREAFDLLKLLWPPENTVEYFQNKAYPSCAVAHEKMKDNPLGQRLVEDVYWHLGDAVREMNQ